MVSQEPSTARGPLSSANAREPYAYLETIGRVTGRRHVVELWFGTADDGRAVFILAGGGEQTQWVRNIDRDPHVRIRIGGRSHDGIGSRIAGTDREASARRLLAAKYQGWSEGKPLSGWARESLPIAVDLESDDS
jgi:deazaflavin-dependent oxidoreductase (nitroreductase family)